ncbi:hypothetical protein [Flavobacterium crassostreae]|uniref:NlpE C-terminal OB domain-containing protein n=1 Tax=Flavobacterium crassostreae TaxID=1763534 RepID=A0A1B9E3K8_9FLAO|nr:hypothetical protein [Flavobacterium crassostreae]OCB76516.1 hypothetical protein LPBF_06135 [Flavobacterium crassostreae]
MKNKALLLLLICTLSCQKKNSPETPPKDQTSKTQDTTNAILLEGKLSIGFEVSSFRPCNDTLDYWIEDNSGKMDLQYTKLVGPKNQASYKEVYCSLKGIQLPKLQEGFAADYDGYIQTIRIIKMDTIYPNKNCNTK